MGLLLSICVDESEHLWKILNIISSDAPLLTITGYVLLASLLALQFKPHQIICAFPQVKLKSLLAKLPTSLFKKKMN